MKTFCRVPLGVVILLLISSSPGFARLEFHPGLTLREEYNDNIFLTDDNREGDLITTLIPALNLAWEGEPGRLSLDYGLEFQKYLHNSSEDRTSLADIQRGLILAELFPGRDFSADLLQEFAQVNIDERRPSVQRNPLVNSTTLSRTVLNPRYRAGLSPTLQLALDYRYDRLAYESDLGDDLDGHTAGVALKKSLSRRVDTMLGAEFGTYRTSLSPDYDLQVAVAGASFMTTPALQLTVLGGPAWIAFDGRNDDETFVGDALMLYELSARSSVAVGASRDLRNSVDQGLFRREVCRLMWGWNIGRSSYFGRSDYAWGNRFPETGSVLLAGRGAPPAERQSYLEWNTYWLVSDFYLDQRVDRELGTALTGRHYLRGDWYLPFGVSLAAAEFDPGNENVTRFGVNAGIEYRRNRLAGSLEYVYRQDDSEIDADDFRNNILFLQISYRL